MQKEFTKFLWAIFIFSLLAATLIYFGPGSFLGGKTDHTTWILFFYFNLVTLLFHFGLLRASEGKPQAFVRYYMGATTFKLFIHIAVILLYCLFNRNEAVRFIITFLIFYVLYTVFEIVIAIRKFGKQNAKKE